MILSVVSTHMLKRRRISLWIGDLCPNSASESMPTLKVTPCISPSATMGFQKSHAVLRRALSLVSGLTRKSWSSPDVVADRKGLDARSARSCFVHREAYLHGSRGGLLRTVVWVEPHLKTPVFLGPRKLVDDKRRALRAEVGGRYYFGPVAVREEKTDH